MTIQYNFRDKVVLVTGAASGIGRATALAFAKAGASVLASDVDASGGEAAVALMKYACRTRFVRCDVANPADVKRLIGETIATFGRIDCAFNDAGIEGTQAPLADLPDEAWNRVIAVNLTGVYLCMKHELRAMAGKGGAIVNCASILGQVGFANADAYVAAKHGVLGLTRASALENAAQGIRVNAVCPGFIETPMLARAGLLTDPEARKAIEALHPMKRLGRAEEVADTVLWLCSEAASFVTGQAIFVDGGYTAQ